MDPSLNLMIEDEIESVIDFLLCNKVYMIQSLRLEFLPRYLKGRMLHKGFKFKQFKDHIEESIKQRLREGYTKHGKWLLPPDKILLIEDDLGIQKLYNEIIKEVLDE